MLGYNSGKNITSGNKNTFLGSELGSNISSGSSNIIIGHNIDTPNADDDYKVIIDSTENTGNNSLIYGDQSPVINTLNLNADVTISNNNSSSNGNFSRRWNNNIVRYVLLRELRHYQVHYK